MFGLLLGFLLRAAVPDPVYESSSWFIMVDLFVPYAIAVGKILTTHIDMHT